MPKFVKLNRRNVQFKPYYIIWHYCWSHPESTHNQHIKIVDRKYQDGVTPSDMPFVQGVTKIGKSIW